jgi:hypothetical protein
VSLLPLTFGIFSWVGADEKWVSALWTIFGTAGGTYALAVGARNYGKSIEPNLWLSWGGAPTTQLLRHGGPANPVMRQRWHKYLSRLIGSALPTEAEELADPKKADQVYEAATRLLINKTRDKNKFPLVYKENVQYGLCRNLCALKGVGIFSSAFGLIVSLGSGVWYREHSVLTNAPWVYAGASCLFMLWWLIVVKTDWVKIPAFAYANMLFEATENLTRSAAPKDPSSTGDKK